MAGSPWDFLDTKSAYWTRWLASWRMNARRGFGQPWLDLMQFVGESAERYAERQNRSTYCNFMHSHASAVTGQLRQQGAPDATDPLRFSMGDLGKIRSQEQVNESDADYAELIYYDVDSTGGDGSEWPAYFDAVDERAQHSGHRLLMVETPPRNVIKASSAPVQEAPLNRADFLAGVRPYMVEFDPEQMPFHVSLYGRREFCVLRVPVDAGKVVNGAWEQASETDGEGNTLGYYLLVRKGCVLLGPNFERGGYWLLNGNKKLLRTGIWRNGQIPLWYHYGEKSAGTVEAPSESRSATEGLGRVGVSLMDTMSARDWDAFDAARSGKWFSPATPNVMEAIKTQWDQKNLHIGVPLAFDPESGITEGMQVTVTDDSAGAVAPGVFQAIVDAKFVEAREQSFQALTSLPGSSGYSKEVSYFEVKAPYLSRRASLRQQSEQNAIRNFQVRMGTAANGFATYKRQYSLAPVTEDIDAAFAMLRANALRAPSLEAPMALASIKQRLGVLPRPEPLQGQQPVNPDAFEQTVLAELQDSAEAAGRAAAQAAALQAQFGA